VSFVRTAGIQFFSEVELAVLYLIAAVVLLVKPTGLFGDA
jgi:branched-chain amino acid transport system permease protein